MDHVQQATLRALRLHEKNSTDIPVELARQAEACGAELHKPSNTAGKKKAAKKK
jgi:hypothetical protein